MTDNKKKPALLTIVVTGRGKPINLAEVKVKFPAGNEAVLKTNAQGEATFTCDCKGTTKVRVIADEWMSLLKDVSLVAGPQRVTIVLEPL